MYKGNQKRFYFQGAVYFTTCNTYDWVRYFTEAVFCEVFIANLRLCKVLYDFYLYAFVVMPNHFHMLFQPFEAEDMSKVMQFVKKNTTRNINYILGYTKEEVIDEIGEALYMEIRKIAGAIDESLIQGQVRSHFEKIIPQPEEAIQQSLVQRAIPQPEEAIQQSLLQLVTCFHNNKLFESMGITKLNLLIKNNKNLLKNISQKFSKYRLILLSHYMYIFYLKKLFIINKTTNKFPKFRWQKSFYDHYIRNDYDFNDHINYIYTNPFKHQIPNPENYKYVYTNYPELTDT